MVEITAQLVKELRDKTNVGMMDCKQALMESSGDMEKAIENLRKKGKAVAAKRSGRATNEGVVASRVSKDGKVGLLVEVNSETDFVARNEIFRAFVGDLAEQIEKKAPSDLGAMMAQPFVKNEKITVQDALTDIIGKIGENIQVRRMERLSADDRGSLGDYIHMGGKIGVLVKIGFTKPGTENQDAVRELVKDLCMQVAASAPLFVTPKDIPQQVLEKEKEIQRAQIKDKPANVIDKIVEGKLHKYYSEVCLLQQPFVKEQKISVKDHIAGVSKKVGDEISVACFVRFVLGEEL